MKLANIVGIVLIGAIFSYALLTIFGTLTPIIASVSFFILTFSILIIVVLKQHSWGKKDKSFIIFEVFVLCLLFAVALGGTKAYSIENEKNKILFEETLNDMNSLSDMNDYYTEYMTYIQEEISNYELSNSELSSQIEEEKTKEVEIPPIENPVIQEVVEIPIYEEEPEEIYDLHFEYNEDEEEDDD